MHDDPGQDRAPQPKSWGEAKLRFEASRAAFRELELGQPHLLVDGIQPDDLNAAVRIAGPLASAIRPDATVADLQAVLTELWHGEFTRLGACGAPKDVVYRDYFRLVRVEEPLTSLVVGIARQLLDVLIDIEVDDTSITALDIHGLITGSLGVLESVLALADTSTGELSC